MKFSIIIPTYNRENFICTAIESVLNQTYSNWELIIIDDGSTDNTKEIVSNYSDQRIKYIYQNNAERSAARNRGIDEANGDWICFLDSDDYYLNHHLQILHEYIRTNPDCAFFISQMKVVGDDIKEIIIPNFQKEKDLIVSLLYSNVTSNMVCLKSEILVEHKFNPKFKYWEDTHLWLRIAADNKPIIIEEVTSVQIIHDSSTVYQSRQNLNLKTIKQAINCIKDLRNNHKSHFKVKLSSSEFTKCIDSKYRTFLYINRQDKRLFRSCLLWFLAIKNKPSFYLLSELPKIFLNKLGIGIHG